MRRFVTVVLAALSLAPAPALAAPDPPAPVAYRPPADAPLTDTFRPPATPYGPGNRGVDYALAPGQPVLAAADGEVVFAGQVGGSHHVVVLHADGLRTSYSFLAGAGVRRGDRVRQGDPVGTAGPVGLHFGVRAGEAYLDPLELLGQRPGAAGAGRAHLVADPDERRPLAEAVERRRLLDSIRDEVRQAVGAGAAWVRDHATEAIERKVALARVLIDSAIDRSIPLPVYLVVAALRWDEEQATCTPASTPVPYRAGPADGRRRIVILVGGLGSSTGDTSVLDVDTKRLGYDPDDVHQFSYRDDPTEAYDATDSLGDIGAAGRRLAREIRRLQQEAPGAVVDVIAHSQGGLVARSAITTHHAAPDTVVTLATPHQGADLATAAAGVDGSVSGDLLLRGARALTGAAIDPTSTSVRQMSETSDFLRDLPEGGWPPTTRVVAIGGRGDPIVPSHQARLEAAPPAAYNVVVSPYGTGRSDDHRRLPGSPEATVEIARAIADEAPTCRSLPDTLLDEAMSRTNSSAQDLAGSALAIAGLYVDARARTAGLDAVRR